MEGSGEADDREEGGAAVSAPVANETERAKRWNRASEDVRSRADTSAKAIGALGTTALSAVGIAKFGDVFPLPAGDIGFWVGFAVVAVPLAFFAMAYAIVRFSVNLWHANEPIMMVADPASIDGLNSEEQDRVRAVYDAAAGAHRYKSLVRYEQHAATLEKQAGHRPPPEDRDDLLAEAQAIRADVDEAEQRALLNVARLRAKDSVTGRCAARLYALFTVALVVFAIGVDYLDSERSARVTTAKACADAVKAIDESSDKIAPLLPPICGGRGVVRAAAASTPTARGELSGAVADLGARYDACVTAARTDADLRCARIKATLRNALEP